MTSATNLGSLVPGFDFLQGLMKSGSSAMPGIGQWIAPTLDPAELQKRIDELRTVQFWLEQNSKLLGTTIQALEVQRMTLATLKGMNVPIADLAGALTLGRGSDTPARSSGAKPASAAAASANAPAPLTKGSASKSRAGASSGGGAAAAGVDAMQWWGALTQQFTELATKAWRDSSAEVARNLKGSGAQAVAAGALDSIERAMGRAGKSAAAAAPAAPSSQSAPPATSAAPAASPAPAKRRRKS